MNSTKKEIRYVSYGLANSFYNRIEMHKDLLLPKYSRLHGRLLDHELKHSNKPFSWKDMALDMRVVPGALTFMITRPSTWCDFSPIWKRNNNWTIDWNLIIFYGVTSIVMGFLTIFMRKSL